jgi:RNA polymerase sigma factor (sigma-70 family)
MKKKAVYCPPWGTCRSQMSTVVFRSFDDARSERIQPSGLRELPRLHIADFDPKRDVPVEDRFRTVAIEIASVVFGYRKQELTDLALTSNLAEEAIYKANWALYGRSCDNLAGYVFTIFKRDADEYLQRDSRIESYDAKPAGCRDLSDSSATSEDVERQILVREALESLDDVTRWICLRRFLHEDSPQAIGRELGMSANSVSVRLSRGLQKIRTLLSSKRSVE